MYFPHALKSGDNVAIIAPASPFRADELLYGLKIISETGLVPVLGPNVRNLHSTRDVAGNPQDRAAEMMWAFTDSRVAGIITALGGYGSAEILPYLDYDLIRESKKPLLGMSDISALNNALMARSDLVSINGQYPSIRLDEGRHLRNSDSLSMVFVLEMMMSTQPWADRPFVLNRFVPRTVSPGKAYGRAVGVNLHVLQHLIGTPYMPPTRGNILFIEGTHQDGQMLGRALTQFKLAGILDEVAGVVIGEFVEIPKKEKEIVPSIEDIIHQFFAKGPPCAYGYSFSHGPYTIPIPVGAPTYLDADTGKVTFDFSMA